MKTEAYSYGDSEGVILLPGKVFGPNGDRNVRLVFDSGAYRTILKTQLRAPLKTVRPELVEWPNCLWFDKLTMNGSF